MRRMSQNSNCTKNPIMTQKNTAKYKEPTPQVGFGGTSPPFMQRKEIRNARKRYKVRVEKAVSKTAFDLGFYGIHVVCCGLGNLPYIQHTTENFVRSLQFLYLHHTSHGVATICRPFYRDNFGRRTELRVAASLSV